MRFKINQIMGIIVCCFIFLFLSDTLTVQASASAVKEIHEFEDLGGDAQYLAEKYRENYYLDLEETGILDGVEKLINNIANGIFSGVRHIAYLTISIFYFAMDFDITKLFASQINGIQNTLNSGLFKPLFPLLFAFSSITIVKTILRKNLIGTVQEISKIVVLVIISILLVSHSSTILSAATGLTKSVGVTIINGINNEKNVSSQSYAASVSGTLWVNLVHEPWITFQFNEKVDDETIDSFLKATPGTKKREALVEEYMKNNPDSTSFNKNTAGWRRAPFILIYLFVMIAKCAIYLLIAVIQIVFQGLAILVFLLAPLILLLAMMPGYGMSVVTAWLQKLFETQLSILIVTFILGLLIKFDSILYDLTPEYGWFIVIILQTILMIGIVLGRNHILKGLANLQRATSTPGYMKSKIRRSGNVYEKIERMSNTNKVSRNKNVTQDRTSAGKEVKQKHEEYNYSKRNNERPNSSVQSQKVSQRSKGSAGQTKADSGSNREQYGPVAKTINGRKFSSPRIVEAYQGRVVRTEIASGKSSVSNKDKYGSVTKTINGRKLSSPRIVAAYQGGVVRIEITSRTTGGSNKDKFEVVTKTINGRKLSSPRIVAAYQGRVVRVGTTSGTISERNMNQQEIMPRTINVSKVSSPRITSAYRGERVRIETSSGTSNGGRIDQSGVNSKTINTRKSGSSRIAPVTYTQEVVKRPRTAPETKRQGTINQSKTVSEIRDQRGVDHTSQNLISNSQRNIKQSRENPDASGQRNIERPKIMRESDKQENAKRPKTTLKVTHQREVDVPIKQSRSAPEEIIQKSGIRPKLIAETRAKENIERPRTAKINSKRITSVRFSKQGTKNTRKGNQGYENGSGNSRSRIGEIKEIRKAL